MTAPDAIVYVVDDDVSVRRGLECLLLSMGLHVEAFGSAQDFLRRERPDVPSCLVSDIRLPGMSGLELQRSLAQGAQPLPTILITGHADIPMCVQAMKAGAVEFMTKPVREQDLLDAIQRALEADREARARRAELHGVRRRYEALTRREREVMERVVQGLLNKQIAADLGACETTIKIHRSHVMAKMACGSLPDLVRMADRLGLLDRA